MSKNEEKQFKDEKHQLFLDVHAFMAELSSVDDDLSRLCFNESSNETFLDSSRLFEELSFEDPELDSLCFLRKDGLPSEGDAANSDETFLHVDLEALAFAINKSSDEELEELCFGPSVVHKSSDDAKFSSSAFKITTDLAVPHDCRERLRSCAKRLLLDSELDGSLGILSEVEGIVIHRICSHGAMDLEGSLLAVHLNELLSVFSRYVQTKFGLPSTNVKQPMEELIRRQSKRIQNRKLLDRFKMDNVTALTSASSLMPTVLGEE